MMMLKTFEHFTLMNNAVRICHLGSLNVNSMKEQNNFTRFKAAKENQMV